MEGVIRAIESEISTREQELSALRESLENLRKVGEGRISISASTSAAFSGAFEGQKVGSAVRQYMQTRKSPATLDEIREALTVGGVQWGKYPKRQVALVVSTNSKTYTVKGELVSLK